MSSIQSSSASSSNAYIGNLDHYSKQIIEQCALRIQKIIQEVKIEIPRPNDEEMRCIITQETLKDPVVIACGHIFERLWLVEWQGRQEGNASCPLCREHIISNPQPVPLLRNLIEKIHKEDLIPTFSHFKRDDEPFALQYEELAKKHIEKGEFQEALDAFVTAFKYTKFSERYEAIPKIYDLLNDPSKAALSRLYLTQYYLEEGKIQQAIGTLKDIKSDKIDVNPIIIFLKYLYSPSLQMMKETLEETYKLTNSEDKISIYTQIIALDPYQFDTHIQLINLTRGSNEKKKLLLQAADYAKKAKEPTLEAVFRRDAERVAPILTKAVWINPQSFHLPFAPEELLDWINESCPFEPDKKRGDTHIVFPIFSEVRWDDNGPSFPLNLGALNQLDKVTGGTGCSFTWCSIPPNIGASGEFLWGAMYHNIIPGSRNKLFDPNLLPQGYEIPGVFEVALGLMWVHRRIGLRYFDTNNPRTYVHCKERIRNSQLCVGDFTVEGLTIAGSSGPYETIGMGALRKFKL